MQEQLLSATVEFVDGAYLKTRYVMQEDGNYVIRVGRGARRDVLRC